jgi:hypothetical protein
MSLVLDRAITIEGEGSSPSSVAVLLEQQYPHRSFLFFSFLVRVPNVATAFITETVICYFMVLDLFTLLSIQLLEKVF